MTEAIGRADGPDSLIDRSPGTLKVFVAPEFYFRSKYGGYTDMKYFGGEGAGRDSRSIVGGLADAVQDERWKDWLFVFGTSVVVAGPFIAPEIADPDLANKIAVLNIALVQKGGFGSEEERTSKSVAVIKEYMSGIDWSDFPDVKFKQNDVAHFPAGPISYASEVNTPGQGRGAGYNGGAIFRLDDITFGLEVCADHGMRRLWRAKPLAGDTFVQIQLVPSGGATILLPSVATAAGGLVFNVDGLSTQLTTTTDARSDVDGYHSELYSVLSADPATLAQMAPIQPLTSVAANADLAEVQKVFWLPPHNDATKLDVWSPDLMIYSVVDIPAPVRG
jgi:hypothetical protein